MRKKLFFFISWTMVVLSLPLLGLALLSERLGWSSLCEAITENFLASLGKLMLRLSGSTVKVEGLEHLPQQGPVLFVSNHQGHFDSAVLLAYIRMPKSFVATSEASKIPILKQWFALAKTVYFERDNIRQNYVAIQQAQELIQSGRSLVIYPEGIISSSPKQGDFKRGPFKLAFNAEIPIIPLAIDGTWRVMGPKSDTIEPAKILLQVLPPVSTKGLSRIEQQQVPSQVSGLIQNSLRAKK